MRLCEASNAIQRGRPLIAGSVVLVAEIKLAAAASLAKQNIGVKVKLGRQGSDGPGNRK